jgi:hypothetical protein
LTFDLCSLAGIHNRTRRKAVAMLRTLCCVALAAIFCAAFLSPAVARGEVTPVPAPSAEAEGKITPEEAVRIVAEKLRYKPAKNSHLVADRTERREGREYHVVQGYNLIITNPANQTGHSATWGWFFVDMKTGAAFRWDLVEDKLVAIKPLR